MSVWILFAKSDVARMYFWTSSVGISESVAIRELRLQNYQRYLRDFYENYPYSLQENFLIYLFFLSCKVCSLATNKNQDQTFLLIHLSRFNKNLHNLKQHNIFTLNLLLFQTFFGLFFGLFDVFKFPIEFAKVLPHVLFLNFIFFTFLFF